MNAAPPADSRMRLDELLVRRGEFATRSRARDAIERRTIRVEGEIALKPGQSVPGDVAIEVDDPARRYVSRAALKLIAGLDHFRFDPDGCDALDIGASTGGFTEVLLERGAAHVSAIDVGHGQFAAKLAADPRVSLVEGLNVRDLTRGHLQGRLPDFVVCDVSFISLRLALPPALELAAPGARAILLVKPQFEAGRAAIGKGGRLRDPETGPRIAEELRAWLDALPGWRGLGLCPSPIDGGDGNREFLLAGTKNR
jgi:23S rRNA (cytidine1920-2'-O)/16S rRNA (cytidine1409-2'-O)-methyltransferase